jgi:Leucine-rich repeat (LRR) protein
LTGLPDGLFKNQKNLQKLKLWGKNLKLRVSLFEGLTSLSELWLQSMDLNQIEENFFQSLNIRKLSYSTENRESIFPIESLNSQETIEELEMWKTDFSELPETLGSTLRSMKQLKKIDFKENSIGSVEAFVDLPNVEKIDLRGNKIEELPGNDFKGCPRLSKLHLFDNLIKKLRGDEFNQLSVKGIRFIG